MPELQDLFECMGRVDERTKNMQDDVKEIKSAIHDEGNGLLVRMATTEQVLKQRENHLRLLWTLFGGVVVSVTSTVVIAGIHYIH